LIPISYLAKPTILKLQKAGLKMQKVGNHWSKPPSNNSNPWHLAYKLACYSNDYCITGKVYSSNKKLKKFVVKMSIGKLKNNMSTNKHTNIELK
jgi:hypothetical protein